MHGYICHIICWSHVLSRARRFPELIFTPMEFILFEHIDGYALFELKEKEDISAPKIGHFYADISRLLHILRLVSFFKFDNLECISDHLNMLAQNKVHDDLKNFLALNNVSVVHCDKSLAQPLCEAGFKPRQSDVIQRAIRLNQNKLLKIPEEEQRRHVLSASHSFSRSKIEYDVKKEDNQVIQSSLLVEQLQKDIYLYSKRLLNIYDFCFPELKEVFPETGSFIEVARILGDFRFNLEEKLEKVEDRFGEEKRRCLDKKFRTTIGNKVEDSDAQNIVQIVKIIEEKIRICSELQTYLRARLHVISPNLTALVGDRIASKLISQAGGLLGLAKCPSSTVQVLGAEAALFRSLKTKTPTPKYGILFNSEAARKTKDRNKGRIARFLASKISIASKIDYFGEEKDGEYGKALKSLVDDKLRSFDTHEDVERTDVILQRVAQRLRGLRK